jgi:hypothetical protein
MMSKYTKIISILQQELCVNVGQPFYHYCRYISDFNHIDFDNGIGYADLRETVVKRYVRVSVKSTYTPVTNTKEQMYHSKLGSGLLVKKHTGSYCIFLNKNTLPLKIFFMNGSAKIFLVKNESARRKRLRTPVLVCLRTNYFSCNSNSLICNKNFQDRKNQFFISNNA